MIGFPTRLLSQQLFQHSQTEGKFLGHANSEVQNFGARIVLNSKQSVFFVVPNRVMRAPGSIKPVLTIYFILHQKSGAQPQFQRYSMSFLLM